MTCTFPLHLGVNLAWLVAAQPLEICWLRPGRMTIGIGSCGSVLGYCLWTQLLQSSRAKDQPAADDALSIRLRSAAEIRWFRAVVAQFVPRSGSDVFPHDGKFFRARISVRHKDDTCAWAAATPLAGALRPG